MKLIETKKSDDYLLMKYEVKKGLYRYTLEVYKKEKFEEYKRYYNGNGYIVTKVYIKGNNEAFKLIICRGNIYTHGRTQYIKHNRKIPFYLTGL